MTSNQIQTTYFKTHYFPNINPIMQDHLAAAKISSPLLMRIENKLEKASLSTPFTLTVLANHSEAFRIPDHSFELPAYAFKGWKVVRDNHHVMPTPTSYEQSRIYAGKSSVIHETGISDPNFLWKSGDVLTPIGKNYDFYAQWSPIHYLIKYKAKTIWGEQVDWSHSDGTRSIERDYFSKIKPELSHYRFIGWEIHEQGNRPYLNKNEEIFIPRGMGSVTLFAIFDYDTY